MSISIITVVYNDKVGLSKTIDSVVNQKGINEDSVEYIVIDGGSTDGSFELILEHQDTISAYTSETDFGVYDAMNKGIDIANNDYLIFMNAGDVFYSSDVISKLLMVMSKEPQVDLFYSDTQFSDGRVFYCDANALRVIHQSLCYRKSLHKIEGYYMVGKKWSISDYMFFSNCKHYNWMKVNTISSFDLGGISSNANHYYQKLVVDLLYNDMSFFKFSVLFLQKKLREFFK
ncbi:glycosyltransferase [Vibrio breoganii]|uniref:glycosyltransferase n=1 Tax=Vibrio breoganii TaxID=553239 RepID=UPI000C841B0F|nr:glycosyltransferase [Vibrio breoganii]PML13666.1 hypothetical protein BCT84_13105 [Vibrio breoganii]